MKWPNQVSKRSLSRGPRKVRSGECAVVRAEFSAYLDGAVSGVQMAAISRHLKDCDDCAKDFNVWREVQRSLGELGPQAPPARLQARLRAAIAAERERGAHLPFFQRMLLLWRSSIAPLALRLKRWFRGDVAAGGWLCSGCSELRWLCWRMMMRWRTWWRRGTCTRKCRHSRSARSAICRLL